MQTDTTQKLWKIARVKNHKKGLATTFRDLEPFKVFALQITYGKKNFYMSVAEKNCFLCDFDNLIKVILYSMSVLC